MSLCQDCARADDHCPSYPSPVDHCQQYVPSQRKIQDWWWSSLGDREVVRDRDGD